jgi:hypothetical protein
MSNSFETEKREFAHALAKARIAVFVVNGIAANGRCECGDNDCELKNWGKHPLKGSNGFYDATTDPVSIDKMLVEHPEANLAVRTGKESGLTVIDIDAGDGKVGAATWAELIDQYGEPNTLKAQTGGGGGHLFFKYCPEVKTGNNRFGKHVDVKNDGGYVLVAPSRHRSGGIYKWINWGTPVAVLPEHLKRKKKETRGRPRKNDPYRQLYSEEEVWEMLTYVPPDDRDMWRAVGIILGREFSRSDKAWTVYVEWAAKWDGTPGRGHDENMRQCFYDISQESCEKELSLGTIIKAAIEGGWVPKKGEVSVEQFVYDHESNKYIYRPSGAGWIDESVDAACGAINEAGKLIKASVWIQQHAHITTTTCTPAINSDVLKGYDCRDGVLFESLGGAVYNKYRPPTIELGDASLAKPFIVHCQKLFNKPGDCDQVLSYLSHRVQRPEEKPRFALMTVGPQGVGKDTSIDMCCPAIGEWNVANIPPTAFEAAFNEYATKTLVRINEAANSAEMSRWAFNERMKNLIAGNPDVCEINPKYGRKYTVKMYCGVVITSNHLLSSIHIPEDDRRYDVIECATLEEMDLADEKIRRDYFTELWNWFLEKDGARHVAAFLHERDLSGFSAAMGQRKTAAHAEMVHHGMVGDEWLADILDKMMDPAVVRGDWIMQRP